MDRDKLPGKEWIGGCIVGLIVLCAGGWACLSTSELPVPVINAYIKWRRLPEARVQYDALLDDLDAARGEDVLLYEHVIIPLHFVQRRPDCTGSIYAYSTRIYGTERPFADVLSDLRAALQRREGEALTELVYGETVSFWTDTYYIGVGPPDSIYSLDPLAWKLFPVRWEVYVHFWGDVPQYCY